MTEPRLLRVREPAAVLHPETGAHVVPDPRQAYRENDPLVIAYPWMFESDEDRAQEADAPPVESVPIERATRAPGERRQVRRGR